MLHKGIRLPAGAVAILSAVAGAQIIVLKAVPVSGEKLFGQQCGVCHYPIAGETRVGPSLDKVVGRRAGSMSDFQYSPALKRSGLVWNASTLDKWLTSFTGTLPGTLMPYTQADAAKRKDIISYLYTLK